jgi:DNA modification methylase
MFNRYNKSSENMSAIQDNLIDLIIAGPPYNIGTNYKKFKDLLPKNEFRKIIKKIFSECFRVLNKKGIFIVESSDTSYSEDEYISLAGFFQDIALECGFYLRARHINFTASENGIELLEHDWEKDYSTKKNAHSNCHQWIVFSKEKSAFKYGEGKIVYSNYFSSEGHPCPFPKTHFFLLDKYFKKGMDVLDPFMGTATLGVEVLKRGGNFYGYEIVKDFYETAKRKLEEVKQ